MSNFFTIWRRELAACFFSPVAYVLMVAFLVVSSGTFLINVVRGGEIGEPFSVLLFESVIIWLTILVTVISMRLFAEEKRSGSLELLMTVPVTETEVVLGKFAGALSFLIIVVAPVAGTVLFLAALSPNVTLEDLDFGALLGGGLMLALLAAFCVAVGLLVSLTTRNQIIAAIGSFCAVWFVLLMGWVLSIVPGVGGLADYLSAPDHLESFSRGVVDTRPVVLYVSGTVLVLFGAVRLLESSRWR